MNSIWCIKNYIDGISPRDAVDFVNYGSSDRKEKWTKWLIEMKEMKGMQIHQRESKKFFVYLYRLSNIYFNRESFLPFGIKIKDLYLLRWLMSMSVFRNFRVSGGCTIEQMNKISKAFPDEFPSVCISESKNIQIPECVEYVVVGDYGIHKDVPNDLSFENIGIRFENDYQSGENVSYPSFCCCSMFFSLPSGTLTDLELDFDRTSIDTHPQRFPFLEQQMKFLKHLSLWNCNVDLESISTPETLESLKLAECGIPSSIGSLVKLQELTVYRCNKLTSLLESIKHLKMLNAHDNGYPLL